jgi:hypothetical protein
VERKRTVGGGKDEGADASDGESRTITDDDLRGGVVGQRGGGYTETGAHVSGCAAVEDPLAAVAAGLLEGQLVQGRD